MNDNYKMLFIDLETFPNLGYTWGKYEQDVIKFVREVELASFAYKFAGDKTVKFAGRNTYPSVGALAAELHRVMDLADIVVAHNLDQFDDRIANTEFLRSGLGPVNHKTIDTLKVARSKFRFNSNKLDDLGAFLGVGRKAKHPGFSMWEGCMAGDPASWKMMEKYNKMDVVLLENVYLAMRPWMTSHPRLTALRPDVACPKCGYSHMQFRGSSRSKTREGKRYQCQRCAGWVTM